MREIKFRAWDRENKTMVTCNQVPVGMLNKHDDQVMQFTGLHDKNGKEIWEGDIIRIKVPKDENDTLITHGIFPVTFSEGMFCLKMKEGEYALCEYLHQEAEVIGNIYENPELIK